MTLRDLLGYNFKTVRWRIKPMKKVAKTLRKHRELIVNYFRVKKQVSSGAV